MSISLPVAIRERWDATALLKTSGQCRPVVVRRKSDGCDGGQQVLHDISSSTDVDTIVACGEIP